MKRAKAIKCYGLKDSNGRIVYISIHRSDVERMGLINETFVVGEFREVTKPLRKKGTQAT